MFIVLYSKIMSLDKSTIINGMQSYIKWHLKQWTINSERTWKY